MIFSKSYQIAAVITLTIVNNPRLISRDLCITYPEGMITALGNTALKTGSICSFTPVIPIKEGHTDSAISPVFALSYLRSQRYAEVSSR